MLGGKEGDPPGSLCVQAVVEPPASHEHQRPRLLPHERGHLLDVELALRLGGCGANPMQAVRPGRQAGGEAR
jgi:hypothetical protein